MEYIVGTSLCRLPEAGCVPPGPRSPSMERHEWATVWLRSASEAGTVGSGAIISSRRGSRPYGGSMQQSGTRWPPQVGDVAREKDTGLVGTIIKTKGVYEARFRLHVDPLDTNG